MNPFDPNGMGGMFGNMASMMQQMKAQAAATEVTGQAGNGAVIVTANGDLEIVRIDIKPAALDDADLLGDLLQVATNEALRKAKGVMEQQMSGLLGGLPPGLLGM
jgi:DNA-binding YbaB/EbfC family protein